MGYMHKYLEVDLSTSKILEKKLDHELAEKYIGGKGLGAKILYDELKAGIDPLNTLPSAPCFPGTSADKDWIPLEYLS